MTEATLADTPTTQAVNLPPRLRMPKILQMAGFALFRGRLVEKVSRRYGEVFTMTAPVFGNTVMVADPQIAKQLFSANTDDVGNIQPNLSRILGSGSVFALDGADHRRRRKLLTPPFHGKSIKNYEKIFEAETLRESASWRDGVEFESLEAMNRLTLNVILRAVFGAEGEQLDELRRIIPPWVTLGSRLTVMPSPSRDYGRFTPWGRLAEYRRQYDAVIERLIDTVQADPNFETRDDVLTLLLRSTYEDGSAMSRPDIADELLTLLAAGHETTASTLAWAFERATRHPDVLARLQAEAQTDDNEYRQAFLLEVQRARTVIDFAGRHVYAPSVRARRVDDPAGLLDRRRHRPHPRPGRGLRAAGALRSRALRRQASADLRVHPVRRRHPAMRRRRVRQRRDGRRAANGVAPLRDRDDDGSGREGALTRCRVYAEGRAAG